MASLDRIDPEVRANRADFLGAMEAASRERAQKALAERRLEDWRALAAVREAPPGFRPHERGFDLICEVKFASPSAGALRGSGNASAPEAARRAVLYEEAGAAAISVLTEPERFGGSLAHLEQAARSVSVPVLRKDFLVDPVQVLEARVAGAAGVLLITRMLADDELAALFETAHGLGMFVLVEAFDREDLERTLRALETVDAKACTLVGINARNLVTLAVEKQTLFRIAPHLPAGYPGVAESGLETPQDAAELARAGYAVALVGTALMRADDPAALARAMLEEGRRGHQEASPCW